MTRSCKRDLTGWLQAILLGSVDGLLLTPIAGARDAAQSPQMKTLLQAIMPLDYAKQKALLDQLGINPFKELYDYLCPGRMWFAPQKPGPYEGRTMAYGTEIHGPFSSDPKAWASCAAGYLSKVSSNVLESLLAKITARLGSKQGLCRAAARMPQPIPGPADRSPRPRAL
jgi:hypothetical protein